MSNKKTFFAKIIGAQVVAYGLSVLLITKVFLGPTPVVRAEFLHDLSQLPTVVKEKVAEIPSVVKKIVKKPKSDDGQATLPPPWIFEPLPGETTSTPRPRPTRVAEPSDTPDVQVPTIPPDDNPAPTFGLPLPKFPTRAPQPTRRPTAVPPTSVPANPTSLESQTIQIINQRRQAAGLGAVSVDGHLTTAARNHSQYMSSSGKCGHAGQGGSLPFERTRDAGYRGTPIGETVGCGYRSAEGVVDGWWSSPPHKAILMDRSARQIGVGWSGSYQTAVTGR